MEIPLRDTDGVSVEYGGGWGLWTWTIPASPLLFTSPPKREYLLPQDPRSKSPTEAALTSYPSSSPLSVWQHHVPAASGPPPRSSWKLLSYLLLGDSTLLFLICRARGGGGGGGGWERAYIVRQPQGKRWALLSPWSLLLKRSFPEKAYDVALYPLETRACRGAPCPPHRAPRAKWRHPRATRHGVPIELTLSPFGSPQHGYPVACLSKALSVDVVCIQYISCSHFWAR